MKFATITLFLLGLVTAIPTPAPAPQSQLSATISDAIAVKVENALAEKIRTIDAQSVADQAMADLGPAISAALGQYAGTIKKAQLNVAVAAQRAVIAKRDGPGGGASPMAAAATELKKVAEDVGVSIGTMIGIFLFFCKIQISINDRLGTKIGGTIGRSIGDKLASGAEALPGILGVKRGAEG